MFSVRVCRRSRGAFVMKGSREGRWIAQVGEGGSCGCTWGSDQTLQVNRLQRTVTAVCSLGIDRG